MLKTLTCIECPRGCKLWVETDDQGRVIKVTGNQCPKGEAYGKAELQNPQRVLTTVVLTRGLDLKLVPVRTAQPIPKARIFAAMDAVKTITLDHPVKAGDVVVKNFLNLEVDLVATREAVIAARGKKQLSSIQEK
ncbi:MAG: DUF1667 domain-containing protein [Candidatus Omnitrophica bacterium]|nr:DUF1667 domain-containing protein [Candidatus Omnitrophota bacterium]